jgi:hypothetical protein
METLSVVGKSVLLNNPASGSVAALWVRPHDVVRCHERETSEVLSVVRRPSQESSLRARGKHLPAGKCLHP